MLAAFSIILPWPCAVADVLLDTNAIILAQGAMMLGALTVVAPPETPEPEKPPISAEGHVRPRRPS